MLEASWEACHQVGGVYTYLQSKFRTMKLRCGENYFLVGPVFDKVTELLPIRGHGGNPAVSQAVESMAQMGFSLSYGCFITDYASVPVVLFDLSGFQGDVDELKHRYWQENGVDLMHCGTLVTEAIVFGEMFRLFVEALTCRLLPDWDILVHCQEWLSAAALPSLARSRAPIFTVFTTHATVLGRYASAHLDFSVLALRHLAPSDEARRFGVGAAHAIERNAAAAAHAFTTVSDALAFECEVLLGCKPDYVIPNGISPEKFSGVDAGKVAENRAKLRQFIRSFFLPYYYLPSDQTVVLVSSGRFEFRNKGFDVLLDALAVLNNAWKSASVDRRMVVILVSAQENRGVNPSLVESKKRLAKIQHISREISGRVGREIYRMATSGGSYGLPNLNELVEDDLLSHWRQALNEFKRGGSPPFSTHVLAAQNEIVTACMERGLRNEEDDPVKIIYHPEFIGAAGSPIGMDYAEVVRASDVGAFPSGYEPWGYAALESVLYGLPTVVGGQAGFAQHLAGSGLLPGHLHLLKSTGHSEKVAELAGALSTVADQYFGNSGGGLTPAAYLLNHLSWSSLLAEYQETWDLAASRKFGASGLY